jgi:DNA-binding response OmpR family regulator
MLSGTSLSPSLSFSTPPAAIYNFPRLAARTVVRWPAPFGAAASLAARVPTAPEAAQGPDSSAAEAGDALGFGAYRLLPSSRMLLRDGRSVPCGSRAFDLLHLLLLSRGKIVPKEALVKFVWPTTIVEESNLRFQMATLRKVLGEDRDLIKTVPGRGYLLAAERCPG